MLSCLGAKCFVIVNMSAGGNDDMMNVVERAKQQMADSRYTQPNPAAVVPQPAVTTTIHPSRPPPSTGPRVRGPRGETTFLRARDNRSDFFTVWSHKIESFIADDTKMQLELPQQLSANDRRELHMLSEKYNVAHRSEGVGRHRHLILFKDSMHFKAPQLRPAETEMDSIKARPVRHNRRAAGNDAEQEGKYADPKVEKQFEKFRKAQDQNSRAVQLGMTLEELNRSWGGSGGEAAVAQASASDHHHSPAEPLWKAAVQNATSRQAALADHSPAISLQQQHRSYVEQCTSCGSRCPLDYELSKWECNGYCSNCCKETLWTLEEIVEDAKRTRRDTTDVSADAEPPRSKARTEGEEQHVDAAVDALPALPEMTAGEAADLAQVLDFHQDDVEWISQFAGAHSSNLSKSLVFAIDFPDAPAPRPELVTTVFLRAANPGDPVAPLLRSLIASVPATTNSAVVFPGTECYGAAMECALYCDLPAEELQEVCLKLSPTFGAQAFRVKQL